MRCILEGKNAVQTAKILYPVYGGIDESDVGRWFKNRNFDLKDKNALACL